MRAWIGVAAGLALAFVGFSRAVALGLLDPLDHRVFAWFQQIWWPPSHALAEAVGILGGIELTTILAVALFVLLLRSGRRREAVALLVFPASVLLESAGRFLVVHAPPAISHHTATTSAVAFLPDQGSTYPSGHVVRAIILYGFIALVIRRLTYRTWRRRWALALAALLMAAIAFDRLYLATHWASDVLGGILLGAACLAAALTVMRARPARRPAPD